MDDQQVRLNAIDTRINSLDSKLESLTNKVDSKLSELVAIMTAIARLQEKEVSITSSLTELKELTKDQKRTFEAECHQLEKDIEDIKDLIEESREKSSSGIERIREANKTITDNAFSKIRALEEKVDGYINKGIGVKWIAGIIFAAFYVVGGWAMNQATSNYSDMQKNISDLGGKVSELSSKYDKRISENENTTLELWRKVSGKNEK